MDAETVASLLGEKGISTRQLRNYCTLGCPYEERGRVRVFDWFKVLAWYVTFKGGAVPEDSGNEPEEDDTPVPGKKENQAQALLRKTRAEANLKELLLSKQRGQVIDIATAKSLVDRLFGNLKSQLLGAAPALNTRLEGEPDTTSREAVIRIFMEDLCRELSTGKIVGDDAAAEAESDTIDELEAAASDDDINQAVVDLLAADAALQATEQADAEE